MSRKRKLHKIWLAMGADEFCYRFATEKEARDYANARVGMERGWGNTSFIWTKAFTIKRPPTPPK